MAIRLPPLTRGELEERLGALAPDAAAVDRLLAHYGELRRWAPSHSLIGPGTAPEVIERHYAESLAGAELVRGPRVLDVGSGAGFPGLVLAAARPDLDVILLERRQRKAAFLRAVARRMELDVEVLEGDLRRILPESGLQTVDSVTLRAVRLDPNEWRRALAALDPDGSVVIWEGAGDPELPAALERERAVRLEGRQSRIVSYRARIP